MPIPLIHPVSVTLQAQIIICRIFNDTNIQHNFPSHSFIHSKTATVMEDYFPPFRKYSIPSQLYFPVTLANCGKNAPINFQTIHNEKLGIPSSITLIENQCLGIPPGKDVQDDHMPETLCIAWIFQQHNRKSVLNTEQQYGHRLLTCFPRC